MEQRFSKKEAIKFGWQTMKQNFWFFVGLLLVAGILYIAPEIVSAFLEGSPALSLIVYVVGTVLLMIVDLGLLIKIPLNFCDNVKSRLSDLFSQYKLFWRYLFASILYVLVILGGLILLVLPGLYLAIRFQFYGYFIVDRDSHIVESLKRSWDITRGNAWNLFLFGLLLFLINVLGALALFIGLFITLPTTLVAVALVYRKLLSQTEPVPVIRETQG